MKTILKITLTLAALSMSAQTMAQITFYEHDGWRGRTFTVNEEVRDFVRVGFNDRASSVIVDRGEWEVCDDARFGGKCMVLRRGSYESLRGMGMNDRISSVRQIVKRDRYENEAPAPLPHPTYEYRRRPHEEIFEAQVTSTRTVFGRSEQRCWTEHQRVNESSRNDKDVGGALVGAIIGGVLGHQIGGGRGRDIATAGGAVAGAAIGSNAGGARGGDNRVRDVQRCEMVPDQTPDSWDITYIFRGKEHHAQMSAPPGRTIAVNRHGEPRQ
jgi:uncharacterized protein YcfJ